MKKLRVVSLFLVGSLAAALFAADVSNQPKYISPNNDGVQDTLDVKFSVKDKSKITGWALIIEDSSGKVVRTIGNKVERWLFRFDSHAVQRLQRDMQNVGLQHGQEEQHHQDDEQNDVVCCLPFHLL